jgi:anaerobic magnesium-protoporphyrin IX monomethyl ester cyclase
MKTDAKKSKGKVIFVNPNLDYEDDDVVRDVTVYPYPALMILSSVLVEAGYDAILLDAGLYPSAEFRKKLFAEINDDVIYIGFSLMTMNVQWAYKLMKDIKALHPKMKIAVGGFHPTLFPDQMIEDDMVDVVAINESASIIEPLTEALKNDSDLSAINGIYYKKGGVVCKNPPNTELDGIKEMPFINLSLIEHEKYCKNNVIIFPYFPNAKDPKDYITYPILTSFGCPYKCTFCINAILERAYRYRSAEAIVDRIEYLIDNHGANFIILQDEEFCINKNRFIRFVELVEERKLKFEWRTSLRVTNFKPGYIDDDLAQRLQNIGMVSCVMGGESGNQRMLDEIKKEQTVEDIEHALEVLSKTTIVPKISFMVGMPTENDEEIQDTFDLCVKMKKKYFKKGMAADIGIFPFRLYPGSPLFDKAIEELGMEADNHSLKEMAEVSGAEMSEGKGYDTLYKKYVKDPDRFEDMMFLYDCFIWKNPKRSNFIRNFLEMTTMWRIENQLYKFIFIEKSIWNFAKWGRDQFRKVKAMLKPAVPKAEPRRQPEQELEPITITRTKTEAEITFQKEMAHESAKRTLGGC